MLFYKSACALLVGVLCDEAGDCSNFEVTSVEYVRYRSPCRYTIGRLKRSVHCVYRLYGSDRLQAGLFFGQGLIRPVVCTEKCFIRTGKMKAVPNAAENVRNKE